MPLAEQFDAARARIAALLRRERWPLAILVVALVAFAAGTHRVVFVSGNDASRWAHMEALVDHGRSSIEDTRFAAAVDQVILDGRHFSNKLPLMDLIGAAFYRLLQWSFGWSFAAGTGMPQIVGWVTVFLVGFPSAALVAFFFRELRASGLATSSDALWTTLALGAGTLLASFAVTLNNHNLAAALLFAGFAGARRGWGGWAGLAVGLASTIDLLPGMGFVPVFGVILAGAPARRRALGRYGAALAATAVLFVTANLATAGTLLPVRFAPGSHLPWQFGTPNVGGVLLPGDWTYVLRCLFGAHGFFTVSPVLFFGAAGLVAAVAGRGPLPRRVAGAVAAGVLVQCLGHGVVAGSYGGWSYGFRYLIPVIPLLMFFAPLALTRWRERRGRRRWRRIAFFIVLPVSMVLAALGAYHPWPPAYEQEADRIPIASLVTNPVGGNAASWVEQHWPSSALARRLGERFISPRPEERAQYYSLFFRSKADFRTARRYPPVRLPQPAPSAPSTPSTPSTPATPSS